MIRIINTDVIRGLRTLPDQSVHCVVTSPPYWGLRDYGVEGQIGLEKTPSEYLQKMVSVFREVKRVLRDDGTLWLNMGDTYTSGDRRYRGTDKKNPARGMNCRPLTPEELKPKDLIGMPWRVAFALQADGWYLRSDIIWSKPNPMPESITDRPTKSHEYVFLLTKKARYYYDADAVRERYNEGSLSRYKYEFGHGESAKIQKSPAVGNGEGHSAQPNPAGRNRRTVWEITTQPTPEAHFATFPEALVEPCIKAGTSERGCCSVCGAPWERVVDREYPPTRETKVNGPISKHGFLGSKRRDDPIKIIDTKWQPSCSCNANTVPCTVLDPFGGSGTVAKVARDLNRDAILIEINPAYVEIARRKLRANEQLFESVEVITA